MAVLVVVPIVVAVVAATGIGGAVFATRRNETKKQLKTDGLRSAKTKIWRVRDLRRGDHICYPASASSIMYHHAIVRRVIDDNKVQIIHYSGPSTGNGSVSKKSSVTIRMDTEDLSRLADEGKLYRVDYENVDNCYSPDEVIARAKSQFGQSGFKGPGYNLFNNNCEHFATWCKTGEAFSTQSGVKSD